MKILQITPSFYPAHVYGGPIQSIYQLSCHLGRAGCEVRVLTTDANGIGSVLDVEKRKEVAIESKVHVRYCKRIMRHSVSPILLWHLPKYAQWADVVHLRAVYSFPTIFTLLICRILGKPLVWTPHGSLQRWEASRRPILKLMWEAVCRIVAPKRVILHTTCEKEAEESVKRFPSAEVIAIPHGIPVPHIVRRGAQKPWLRLLYIGLLSPKKGVENLLEACHMIRERNDMLWSLTIAGAGDPTYTESIRNRIRQLGFVLREPHPVSPSSSAEDRPGQIHMVGHIVGDEKEHAFEEADVLVVPSYTENFGIVVTEALARGIPVIASTGTPWQKLEEVGCGLWVANDPKSLAAAIETMNQLPLKLLGKKGRAWMEKEFDWGYRTQQILCHYRRLIADTAA